MVKYVGGESICDEKGRSIATMRDFWSWGYSNLTSNTQRGTYAEYLVSIALNAVTPIRTDWADWGPYDVLTPEGIKVEVKCSAYLQAWKQTKLSKIIYGIAQTHKFDFDVDVFTYDSEFVRHADVYVFCLETCKNPDELNERNLSQWEFYVVSTTQINKELGSQKTVSLSTLIKIGARRVSFCDLRAAVLEAYQ